MTARKHKLTPRERARQDYLKMRNGVIAGLIVASSVLIALHF